VGDIFGRSASHGTRIDDGRQGMQPIALFIAWIETFMPLELAKV
jgi:hypothetical protein